MLRGDIRMGVVYEFELKAGITLGDYNMEAQGDLLADYFALEFMRFPPAMAQKQYSGSLALYRQVLASFIADPSNDENLP